MKPVMPPALVVAAAAVLLGACSTLPGRSSSPATISVSGYGEVSVAPDRAVTTVGVQTRDPEVSVAVADNNRLMTQVVDAIRATGVAAPDIRTSAFQVFPQDEFTPEGGRAVQRTYVVVNTVTITVRDLDRLGDVLGAALGAGANSVQGTSHALADPERPKAEALRLAVLDAEARAKAIADAAGVRLGRVLYISESSGGGPAAFETQALRGMGGGVPVSEGTITVSVTVQVSYEIQ